MTSQDNQYAQAGKPDAPPAGTARIGAELRAVRERVGWKLAEVAAELRIREPYLEAIERGSLEELPGPAYQIGFIRTYALALGLDGDEILRRFRAEGAGSVTKPELSFLAPVPDRAVPTGAIVLVGVVLLLLGYGLWFLHTENERNLAAAVPAVPAQLAPLAVPPEAPAPTVAAKPPAPVLAQNAAPTPPAAMTAPGPAATSGAASNATAPAMAPTQAGAAPNQALALAPSQTTLVPGTGPPNPVPPAAPGQVSAGKVIMATADSWVEVKDATGNILFSKVMHSGDSWPVPDMAGLTMTAGNAGGTEIANNGTAGAPLGADGTVVHNYALTAPGAPVTTGTAVPAVTATPSPVPPGNANSSPAKGTN